MKRFFQVLFLLPILVGCASPGWDLASNSLPVTSMECRLKGGAPEQCDLLPEFGFGDWGGGEAIADTRPVSR